MPGLLKPIPSTVRASIDFLDPNLTEKPFSCLGAPPPNMPATNIKPYPVEIVEHDSETLGHLETDAGKVAYYKEMEQLLLSTLPGSTRVHVFNSTIRKKKHDAPSASSARTPENTGPVSRAHNDNTPTTGARRVFLEMGEEAEDLSQRRCQIVNVWRPLSYPAQDCPLAYMDYRTLSPADLRATDLILPARSNEGNRKGENYSVLHNPQQKWYFLSDQTPSECVVFKIYDSHPSSPSAATLTPHSAFVNPTAPADAKPRQSIEIRALVFY
ncbi:hypothetical protein JCM11251_004212 [Rhodosporidiobolus azoricus]